MEVAGLSPISSQALREQLRANSCVGRPWNSSEWTEQSDTVRGGISTVCYYSLPLRLSRELTGPSSLLYLSLLVMPVRPSLETSMPKLWGGLALPVREPPRTAFGICVNTKGLSFL